MALSTTHEAATPVRPPGRAFFVALVVVAVALYLGRTHVQFLLLASLVGVLALLVQFGAPLLAALRILGRVAWRSLVTTAILLAALGRIAWARLLGRREMAPQILREAFEVLGPTWLKLAQLVASSHGLFPENYCREFAKTLDRVRPFDSADMERIVVEELGAPVSNFFRAIDPTPLASASIAQVHAAELLDGRQVVIKVQRPDIAERTLADGRILTVLARLVSLWPTASLANPRAIVDDFRRTLAEELDFRKEAQNLDQFNAIMAELGRSDARAPRVVHALSSARVLVMERFVGVRIDDVAALKARGIDGEAKLIAGMRAWFQCLLFHGFFHGDVHAGNLMLLTDGASGGAIGFLDFGIVGRFSQKTRGLLVEWLLAFVGKDWRRLAETMVALDAVAPGEAAQVDIDALAADVAAAWAPFGQLSLAAIRYSEVVPEVLGVARRHGLSLPRELVLVTKQLLYFDRYAKLLAPELNVFTDARLLAGITEDVFRARASGII